LTEADSLNLVGTTIAEKYAVEAVVGEGGFAVVYRAQHIIWKRPVALKVFKALGEFSAAERSKLFDEFVQEGALLAELSERSAAIVQARDIGMLVTARGESIPYMVLEWLDGNTLESVLEHERASGLPLRTVDEMVRLLEPAAEALALAHKSGIAHRDVKPGNLFILGDPRGDCTVKLLDFGIAKVVADAQKMAGSFTKTGGQVTSFTPAYGAPEQFTRTHGSTGPWTDVFALALIAVEVLSGKAPLDGDDFVQLAVASSHPTNRPTPRAHGVPVSDAVEAVFAKAFAVKATDRFAAAGEFWNALRAAISMAPMRGITTRNPVDLEVGRASTVAAPSGVGPTTAPGAALSSVTAQPPPKGRGALIGGVVVGLAIVVGGAVYVVGLSGHGAPPAASATGAAIVTATPSASASASAGANAGPLVCPPNMIAIPGGAFYMGSALAESEKPPHQVRLSRYCIDKFEVTIEQHKACSDAGKCLRAGSVNEIDGMTAKDHAAYDPVCNARDPVGRAQHPVNCVTWDQAVDYCQEQGKRLPTEAEWEFAALGPDGRKYPWGDDEPAGGGHLNACGAECIAWGKKQNVELVPMYKSDDGWATTAPVGSFPKGASRYGLEDVVGNVWEWVGDWYGPYTKDDSTDPKGPTEGTERVIRGGAWNGGFPDWVRPSFRYHNAPASRSHGIGFRCAK
jgi:formylglycine-generating enzyme required for sulfatase activity/serine/threonine protein kinase